MRVLVVETEQYKTRIVDIDDTLEALQKLVGGYIETCSPFTWKRKRIEMIVNEEGMLRDLPLNENFPWRVYGNAVFVGVNGENFCSITVKQMESILDSLF